MAEQPIDRSPEIKTAQPLAPELGGQRRFERAAEVAAPRPTQSVPVRRLPATDLPRPMPGGKTGSPKSETRVRVESVMEERLESVYKSMPGDVRATFKQKGEETAVEIESMLYKVKVHSKKVFTLLFNWLRIIPGVNKYFLEQEAKLKTDEIMRLKEEMDRTRTEQRVF